ncbi:MAG: Rhs element Vgr protein [Pseudonocardiales bacterium]|nr:Rhs element Vgr protein [Pseudonocardiales bacterium]
MAPVLTLNGQPAPHNVINELVQVRVERGLGLIGRATMRFNDPGYMLSATATFELGTDVKLSVPESNALVEGTITGVSLEQVSGAHPELVVVVDDAAYKLSRGTQVTTYLTMSYSEVISKLAQRHGLQASVEATTQQHEYLLQASSDLEFLNSIVERAGLCWWVDAEVLHVKKVALGEPAVALELGDSLFDFSVRASGLRPTGVKVGGWDPTAQANVVGVAGTPAGGSAAFLSKYVGNRPASALSEAPAAVSGWSPADQGEAKDIADSLYADWAAAAVVARGTCHVSDLIKPGVTIKVTHAGPASGTYLVTELEHVYNSAGFITKFTAGPLRPAGLVDTLGTAVPDPGFVIPGLVVAKVTDVTDPDNVGRVRIKYTAVNGEIESPWARVVSLGAGPERGMVFQPEPSDEVLVGFEHGDSRRPVVIGGLFSKANALPTAGSGVVDRKVDFRRITSRKNHVLEIGDGESSAEQHFLLKLGTAEHKLRLGADAFLIEIADGMPLTIKAGSAKFDISKAGDVTIEGKNVNIKATAGAINLEGTTDATLKATKGANVQGMTVAVKGSVTSEVEGGAQLTLKGGMVQIN